MGRSQYSIFKSFSFSDRGVQLCDGTRVLELWWNSRVGRQLSLGKMQYLMFLRFRENSSKRFEDVGHCFKEMF